MRILFGLIFVLSLVACRQEKPTPGPYASACKTEAIRKITALKRIGFNYAEPKFTYFEQIKAPEIGKEFVNYYGNSA